MCPHWKVLRVLCPKSNLWDICTFCHKTSIYILSGKEKWTPLSGEFCHDKRCTKYVRRWWGWDLIVSSSLGPTKFTVGMMAVFSGVIHIYGSFSPGRGKWAKCVIIFFKLHCDQTVWFFQVCSTVLKRLCLLESKSTFVLVLAIFFFRYVFCPILLHTVLKESFEHGVQWDWAKNSTRQLKMRH